MMRDATRCPLMMARRCAAPFTCARLLLKDARLPSRRDALMRDAKICRDARMMFDAYAHVSRRRDVDAIFAIYY